MAGKSTSPGTVGDTGQFVAVLVEDPLPVEQRMKESYWDWMKDVKQGRHMELDQGAVDLHAVSLGLESLCGKSAVMPTFCGLRVLSPWHICDGRNPCRRLRRHLDGSSCLNWRLMLDHFFCKSSKNLGFSLEVTWTYGWNHEVRSCVNNDATTTDLGALLVTQGDSLYAA